MSTLFDHDLHFFHRNRRNLNEAKTHRKLVTEIIAPLSHRHRMFTARLERYIRRWFNNTSQVLSRKRDTIVDFASQAEKKVETNMKQFSTRNRREKN